MATINVDWARGFRAEGAAVPLARYRKDAAGATPAFIGDLLMIEADANVNPATAGSTELIGVNASFLTAGVAGNVMVYDDPDQKFVGQDDGASATPAVTTLMLNADHVATDGSLTTKRSAHEIDLDSATTAAAGLRLLDFVLNPDNIETADNADWVFTINEAFRGGAKLTGV